MKLLAQDGGEVYEHIRDSNQLEYIPHMMPDYDEAMEESCLRRRFSRAHSWSTSTEDQEGRRESSAPAV